MDSPLASCAKRHTARAECRDTFGILYVPILSCDPVLKLRFTLTNGRLYAFWVSPEATGASHGYVAAGGPGFKGPTDTVG